ncbi:ATP synthase F1 subunit gamma [Sinanaerobacter sp. ZZT-01]|uniref:ATP synthase F1 subunit gamma n=1 Tax=Sinanaerobacter sp. ZZT-01 TaxID=3111540 RepID=UPI002D79FB2B|nr:ATP synthase F1 subunit gamma [Sinanaerobacter sp. ZZT-01]WRR92281.1 ATP synthase F1 subunit gamma [Sinanaerobacter sp. ZZT-01]
MANMREIRLRMKSIQDTMKITNAMYLISSSKLKKARKVLDETMPYFMTLQKTIHDILLHSPDLSHAYFDNREVKAEEKKKRGYIVITADKGLAGGYNHNIIKLAEKEIEKDRNSILFAVGQVGRQYFQKKKEPMDEGFFFTNYNPTRYRARCIAEIVLDGFNQGEIDEVYVVYTRMVTPMRAEPVMVKLLPLSMGEFVSMEKEEYKHVAEYSPSPQEVMNHLVPNYIKGFIYGAMVEAFSAEQHARMTAMQSATDSAKDMIRDLSLLYNRARQASITQEINEVVSGAGTEDR